MGRGDRSGWDKPRQLSTVRFHTFYLLILLVGIAPALAAEPDQFTRRFEPQPDDSSAAINRRVNLLLQAAVDRANEYEQNRRWGSSNARRRESRLYKEMRKEFHNHTKSEFLKGLIDNEREDDGIDRHRLAKADSIFANWSLGDGIIIGSRDSDESRLSFSPLIRMGEVTIGVDKLEHLFERGWHCYDGKYRHGRSDSRVLNLTSLTEKLILGGNRLATGVYSYADIVANFNGMRFWNDVLQKHDDIFGKHENAGPYVVRVGGLWKVNPEKPIDLRHYIDWGMDEGINCSRYATCRGARKVRQALADMSAADPDHTYRCPMDAGKLEQVREKYGKYSKWLVNSRGISRRGLLFNR